MTKLSLRFRLSVWYSTILGLSMLALGAYTYFSVASNLHDNLDASLIKVVNSLDMIMQNKQDKTLSFIEKSLRKKGNDQFALFREAEKMRFVGPIRPNLINKDDEEGKNMVWSAVYENILLNPKNYYIQIADTNNQIIYRSKNLQNDTLPLLRQFISFYSKDTVELQNDNKDSVIKLTYDENAPGILDSIFTNINLLEEDIRMFIKKTNNAIISVGYAKVEIQGTLNQLFAIQIISFPFVLFLSVIGGLILSKLSLRTIDDITKKAEEISATNLAERLPVVETKDEVGHLTRTLNLMLTRLQNSFNQIRKFTSDASHELKTPLTILQGELELALHSQKTPEEYEDLIISSLEEVARLTNVVETLLELSRAETGQIKMNMTENNLSRLVSDIAEDAEILAENKNIKVDTNIIQNIVLPFDNARMHQAILNIVDNAVKYTPRGGSIRIELNKTKDLAELRVSDTGHGIPEDELPFIFDRMYRVDKARSSNVSGAGLGLAIVKWIIDGHKGKIAVDSKINQGTTFTISLRLT